MRGQRTCFTGSNIDVRLVAGPGPGKGPRFQISDSSILNRVLSPQEKAALFRWLASLVGLATCQFFTTLTHLLSPASRNL